MSTSAASHGNAMPSLRINSIPFNNGTPAGAPPSPELNVDEVATQASALEKLLRAVPNTLQFLDSVTKLVDANKHSDKTLEETRRVMGQQVALATTKNDELETECREKDETITVLEDSIASLQEQTASLPPLKEALDKETATVKTLQKRYQAAKQTADRLEGYALKPQPLEPGVVAQKLNNIFTSAFEIVNACFSQDFDDGRFGAEWQQFKENLGSPLKCIPLPPGNTDVAKRMRTAAVLRFLSRTATQQLFQPEYTLERGSSSLDNCGSPLATLLGDLAADPEHANYVRRLVLRLEPAPNSDYDESVVESRKRYVKAAIMGAVAPILTAEQYTGFSGALHAWLNKSANVWKNDIQKLQHGILAYADDTNKVCKEEDFVVMAETPEWAACVPATLAGSRASSATGSSGAGTAGPAGPAGRAATATPPTPAAPSSPPSPNASATSTSALRVASMDDIAACIWPSFVVMDKDRSIARHGLVLVKAQVAEAQTMVNELTRSAANTRKSARAALRSATIDSPTASSGGRSFLQAPH